MEADGGLCSYKPKNTKDFRHTPEVRRKVRNGFSAGSSENTRPCRHLDGRLLAQKNKFLLS